MLNISDFKEKFENYSDEQLYEAKVNADQYSDDGKEALNIVINKRGGIDLLELRILDKKKIDDEIKRIRLETFRLSSKETNAEFIKTLITSDLLPEEKVHEIIDEQFNKFETHVKNITIDSKTITKAVIATLLGSLVGGIYMWFVLSNATRIPILFFIGLGLLCYGIIRLITKKTRANTVVFIATLLSFIFSLLIGYGLSFRFGQPF